MPVTTRYYFGVDVPRYRSSAQKTSRRTGALVVLLTFAGMHSIASHFLPVPDVLQPSYEMTLAPVLWFAIGKFERKRAARAVLPVDEALLATVSSSAGPGDRLPKSDESKGSTSVAAAEVM